MSAATLAQSDWRPFRALMNRAGTFTMLARPSALDRVRPVSFSEPVVSGCCAANGGTTACW